jgi:16S rRNA (cytosine1402-N4)-methyltransferase
VGTPSHRPVLVDEVVQLLHGRETIVDCTLGAGGHTEALLRAGAGLVIGIDRDPEAVEEATVRLVDFGARFRAERARFSEIEEVAARHGFESVDGVLFDLGVSSRHLDDPSRGFAYRAEGPLDMRMGGESDDEPSAADLVNHADEQELVRILREYGEERYAGRIARAIVRRRPITTTNELAVIVATAVPKQRGAHPARRTFQALRIAVNAELEELAASLPQVASLLAPHGRLVAIAYHSGEDRIVKRFVAGREDLTVLTRKPVRPAEEEVEDNPRARSARLRAAEKWDRDPEPEPDPEDAA